MDYVDKLPTCQWCSFAPPEWRIFTPPLTTAEVDIERGVAIMLENIDYWRDAPVWTPTDIADATRDWFKYLAEG
jgi:UDP-glucose 4-epimerase